MPAQIAVFAGPSLYHQDRHKYAQQCDIYSPATSGDLLALMPRGYKSIVLLDGYYNSVPSPWHKEILFALALGCKVIGGSSLGALRASELSDFGMIGIGSVFSQYASLKRSSDADVALLHAPSSATIPYLPLTIPLVDFDFFHSQSLTSGDYHSVVKEKIQCLSNLSYQFRDYQSVSNGIALNTDLGSRLKQYFRGECRGLKNLDAALAIDYALELVSNKELNCPGSGSALDIADVTTKQFYLLQSEANYSLQADSYADHRFQLLYSSPLIQVCSCLLMSLYSLRAKLPIQRVIDNLCSASLQHSRSVGFGKSLAVGSSPVHQTPIHELAGILETYLDARRGSLSLAIDQVLGGAKPDSMAVVVDVVFANYEIYDISRLRLTINWFVIAAMFMQSDTA